MGCRAAPMQRIHLAASLDTGRQGPIHDRSVMKDVAGIVALSVLHLEHARFRPDPATIA